MKDLILAVEKSIENKNYYAALYMSLTLPDICSKIEYSRKRNIKDRYISWFNKYLSKYEGFLSGEDCYALRCAALHEGIDRITGQSSRKILEKFIFLSDGPHCNVFLNNVFLNMNSISFLQLNVQFFCRDFIEAVNKWIKDVESNREIQRRMNSILKIYPPGIVIHGIKFG